MPDGWTLQGHGWFFWNFRTEMEPKWSFNSAYFKGWFPGNVSDVTAGEVVGACAPETKPTVAHSITGPPVLSLTTTASTATKLAASTSPVLSQHPQHIVTGAVPSSSMDRFSWPVFAACALIVAFATLGYTSKRLPGASMCPPVLSSRLVGSVEALPITDEDGMSTPYQYAAPHT